MPGRHGKQRFGRKRSSRERRTEMETTLLDSIHNRTRKERAILSKMIPPRPQQLKRKIAVNPLMSFIPPALPAVEAPAPHEVPAATAGKVKVPKDAKKSSAPQTKKRAKTRPSGP